MSITIVAYQNSLEHLLAELERIGVKIRLQVLKARALSSCSTGQELRGLYIPEEEIDTILATPTSFVTSAPDSEQMLFEPLVESLNQIELAISEKKAVSLREGTLLRLEYLRQIFSLSPFELDTLLICLLPELELRYEKLYAYLHDDVTKKRPTIGLVLDILCSSFKEKLAARKHFRPQSTLIKDQLLKLSDDAAARMNFLLTRPLKVSERIIDYLLGRDEIDGDLLAFAHIVVPQVKCEEVILNENIKSRLVQVTHLYHDAGWGLIWHFSGPEGVGKRTIAEALCHQVGLRLLTVNCARISQATLSFETLVRLIFREARLQNVAIYWEDTDILSSEERQQLWDAITSELKSCPRPIFFAGKDTWQPGETHYPFFPVDFPMPDFVQRKELWRTCFDGQSNDLDDDVTALADKFRLTAGQIKNAYAFAQNLALWREPESRVIQGEDLYAACRQQSSHKLSQLASKITPRYVWADIVLPKDQLEQLREICNYVKYHHLVYGEWGFEHKLSLGKGLNVLFAGPSGTGKTMAADIMANELGLDLYKIDLATVVSKYIGETEKNLDRVFKEAQDSNSILFFDEADAIFGKRSEVRDSHDRYANIEIAYLLQKMEEYQGIVILATNLHKNLDEAFARRMHFSVEFPFPEEEDRYRIWQKAFPETAPLSQDIDRAFMARQFKITGGNIKNIALSAAFLGAEDSGMVTMEHLIRATKREYQKMGKLCTEADFGQFYELVGS